MVRKWPHTESFPWFACINATRCCRQQEPYSRPGRDSEGCRWRRRPQMAFKSVARGDSGFSSYDVTIWCAKQTFTLHAPLFSLLGDCLRRESMLGRLTTVTERIFAPFASFYACSALARGPRITRVLVPKVAESGTGACRLLDSEFDRRSQRRQFRSGISGILANVDGDDDPRQKMRNKDRRIC
jgi:hypothetical protein